MTLTNNFVLISKKNKSFSKAKFLALALLGLCLTSAVVDARKTKGSACGLKCFSFKKCMGQLDGGNRPGQLGNTGQLVLNQCDAGSCDCDALEAEKNREQEKPRSSEVKEAEQKEDERDHRFLLKQRPSFRVRGTFRRPSPSSSSSDTSTSVKTSTSSKSSSRFGSSDARSRRKTSGFTPRKPVRFGKSKPSASKAKDTTSETIEELKKAWAKEKEELLALIAKYRKALGIDLEEKEEQTRPRFSANRRSGSRFVPRRF